RLDIDRAAEPGLQPARATGIVDAWPLFGRDCSDAPAYRRHRLLAPARQRLGPLGAASETAEDPIARGDLSETPVQKRIGDAGLRLYPLGQFDIGPAGRA